MKVSTLCWNCISKKIKKPISLSIAMVQAQDVFRGVPTACYGVCDNCGKEDHGCRAPEPFFSRNKKRR